MAIDAFHFLHTCTGVTKEPLQPLVSSCALDTNRIVSKALNSLSELDVTPTFVFNGLSPKPLDPPRVHRNPEAAQRRKEAWQALKQGNEKTAAVLFSEASNYISHAQVEAAQRCLDAHKIRWLTAPYQSHGQLFYLEATRNAHCVFGPLEALLFPIRTLVTKLDFSAQEMEYLNLDEVLASLSLTHDQFIDLCLVAGRYPCPTFTPVQTQHPKRFYFKMAHEAILKAGDGRRLVTQTNTKADHSFGTAEEKTNGNENENDGDDELYREEYLETFERVRGGFTCAPVLAKGCVLALMNAKAAKSAQAKLFGPELPRVVLQLTARGLVWPRSIIPIIHGYSVIHPPLLDSEELATLHTSLARVRSEGSRAARKALLKLGAVGLAEEIQTTFWYAPSSPTITDLKEDGEEKGGNKRDERLKAMVDLFTSRLNGEKAEGSDNEYARGLISRLSTVMLGLLGVCDAEGEELTTFGSSLASILFDENGSKASPSVLESLLLMSLLIRAKKCLHASPITLVNSKGGTFFDAKTRQESKALRLAARIACFASVGTAGGVYEEKKGKGKQGALGKRPADVDMEIVAFRELLHAAWDTCRQVTQHALLSAVAKDARPKLSTHVCQLLLSSLPFKEPPVAFGGILIKAALKAAWDIEDASAVQKDARKAMSMLLEAFYDALSMRVGELWGKASKLLKLPHKQFLQESRHHPHDNAKKVGSSKDVACCESHSHPPSPGVDEKQNKASYESYSLSEATEKEVG
eukprot:CAMPEP_0114524404 /NCGR_PEP_ID=MMETSP0109-20121206/21836_1 /TAXON_ID=29199 /ORGANISM="Chlorarachnion reptans, Strain CCCM449" /LENGTH=749 /DNA_ID=CAMNT_0001705843 /DNA_START=29 /DNA_END=2275 /DNA_ORIENTATION=+